MLHCTKFDCDLVSSAKEETETMYVFVFKCKKNLRGKFPGLSKCPCAITSQCIHKHFYVACYDYLFR